MSFFGLSWSSRYNSFSSNTCKEILFLLFIGNFVFQKYNWWIVFYPFYLPSLSSIVHITVCTPVAQFSHLPRWAVRWIWNPWRTVWGLDIIYILIKYAIHWKLIWSSVNSTCFFSPFLHIFPTIFNFLAKPMYQLHKMYSS